MTGNNNPLDRIVFISIPQGMETDLGGFRLDPSILLPVELQPGQDTIDPTQLSWEMMLSGMLRVLSHDPGHKNATYFRQFVLGVKPDIERDLTQAGIAKASQHEFELAQELFTAMSALMPEKGRHRLNLALVLEQRAKNYRALAKTELASEFEEAAARVYRETLGLDDCPSEAWLYAGHFHLQLNDAERAQSLFASFLEQEPDHEEAPRVQKLIQELSVHNLSDQNFKLAFDYIRMGQEERGLVAIDEFLTLHPEVWNGHFIKGWALRRLARYQEGIDSFKEAVRLGGGNPDTLNELSICLMETQAFDAAERALNEALAMEPENTKIISNLGILALKRGDTATAQSFFEAVLVYDPEDPVAKEYLRKNK